MSKIFQKKFSNNNLCQLSYSQLKLLIKNHFFNSSNQEFSQKLVAPLFQIDEENEEVVFNFFFIKTALKFTF